MRIGRRDWEPLYTDPLSMTAPPANHHKSLKLAELAHIRSLTTNRATCASNSPCRRTTLLVVDQDQEVVMQRPLQLAGSADERRAWMSAAAGARDIGMRADGRMSSGNGWRLTGATRGVSASGQSAPGSTISSPSWLIVM